MSSIPLSRVPGRLNRFRGVRNARISQHHQCFSCAARLRAQQDTTNPDKSNRERTTHFGFETIAEELKQSKVAEVFSSVATSYDTMNDLMSLGIHRLWKDHFVRSLDPGLNPILSSSPSSPSPLNILDIAGGTGDIAFRLLDHATQVHNDTTARVTVADINPSMLAAGRARLASSPYAPSHRLSFIEANAEHLTSVVPSASVDLYTVAFGVRNFTDIPAALAEAHRVLKPGGVFACLEFSKVTAAAPLLEWAYKRWSFGAIPLIGQVVAGDRDSYQYLVESIERFPDQATFADMIAAAGFEMPRAVNAGDAGGGWEDLSGGIACIHKGIKPVSGT